MVLIDDCDLPGGGKGKTVIEYMTRKGWQVDTSCLSNIAYKTILLDFGSSIRPITEIRVSLTMFYSSSI